MNRAPLRPITDAEVDAFERDGVVCLAGVLDQDWVMRMRTALDWVLAHPSVHGADLGRAGDSGRFVYDNWLWRFSADFRALAFDSPVASLAARMMRSRCANLVFDFLLVKEPHTSTPTIWHQDQPAINLDGTQTCGIWLPLDHVTYESGAVEWVRGSHRWPLHRAVTAGDPDKHGYLKGDAGIAGGEDEGRHRPPLPDISANRDRYDIVWFETVPGDAIVSNLRIAHGAPGNATAGRRRAIGYRFAGDDAVYYERKTKLVIKPPVDAGLKHGDPFPDDPRHPVFPRVWPRAERGRAHA